MAEQVPPRRARLGAKLRELRSRRYASGSALAEHLHWGQSKVSKLERGAQLPTDVPGGDLDKWVEAVGASEAERAELAALVAEARVVYTLWEDRWRQPGAIAAQQRDIAEAEQAATVIREFQPALLPGLVQTPAYARALLSTPGGAVVLGGDDVEIEGIVNQRVQRQQLLYTPGKQIRLLIGEAALRTMFGGRDVMDGQFDRLATLAELSTVDLAVLPFSEPYPLIPVSGFAILDDKLVAVESLTAEQTLSSADEIAAFTAAFEAGMDAATRGADALQMVRRSRS